MSAIGSSFMIFLVLIKKGYCNQDKWTTSTWVIVTNDLWIIAKNTCSSMVDIIGHSLQGEPQTPFMHLYESIIFVISLITCLDITGMIMMCHYCNHD